jgi:uncharacterized protein (TIGR02453 family)
MKSISNSTLEFLTELKKNNNRDWFSVNRSRYHKVKTDYESFIQTVIDEMISFEPILKGLEAKSCTFRINRDIRFSNDKTLYKTNLGAFIVRGGRKNGDRFAGYYLHIEPGNKSMIAGGAYMPPAPWLKLIREKIDEDGDKLLKIINKSDFKSLFGNLEGEKLRGVPRGYSKEHPYIELLKHKSYLTLRMISDHEVISRDFFNEIIRTFKAMKPLNDFLNEY